MKNIIKVNDWVEEETDNMARDGLRTLVVAKRVLPELEFQKFARAYNKARKSLVDRNELMPAETKLKQPISIAFSSRLLTKHDHYTIIAKCKSKEEIDKDLTRLSLGGFNALVIDGESLSIVIEHYLDRFIDVAKNLHCLIGCRYSPTQKALMASRLRIKAKETVLCIGDGGNDVFNDNNLLILVLGLRVKKVHKPVLLQIFL
ncbi:hypothetical protein ACJJTC_013586 [Scirpophaga incertulas]